MPPRYAFWTILIDQQPTAFRAREQAELLPTLTQLRRTNRDVVMKWFSRGRLWGSPEEEREAQMAKRERERHRGERREAAPGERRGREWRPGGQHRDPRARFQKKRGPKGPPRGGPKRGPRR